MRRVSIVVVALAVALRLGWVLLVPTRPVGDFALYLESAAHLLAHHALDAEFIYMPGYVLLLAGVQALGGGLLAAKMVGVAAGGLGAWAVFTIAQRLWDRTTAVVAGMMFAVWPAGIAVASVTGTDMPAAALLAAAVAVLVRDRARGRPWRAAVGFGVVLGLAAYVRAVALPLALLAFPYWLAAGPSTRAGIKAAAARTALGCGVAALVLLPWGIRNQLRYGELFLTDSHGGHTALVGANPNSEGVYSRSLNQMFRLGTGYRLFDPDPRAADRAAYALAKSWAAFEPAYAIGLVAAKADRLLTHERPLLYWPLYRESVLRDPPRAFFDRHRQGIEWLVDGFWYVASGGGDRRSGHRRRAGPTPDRRRRARPRPRLVLPLFPLALVALYATFFSEVRYHLAIAIFMFPYAAAAWVWLARLAPTRGRGHRREGIAVTLAVASLLVGWPALIRAGDTLRARHRWAVCVCGVGDRTTLCNWRATATGGESASPLRGVWDGVGLRLPDPGHARDATAGGGRGDGSGGPSVAAASELDLPPGRYHVTARADRQPAGPARLRLDADQRPIATAAWGLDTAWGPDNDESVSIRLLDGIVEHAAGKLRLDLRAEGTAPATVWLSDIRVERDLR